MQSNTKSSILDLPIIKQVEAFRVGQNDKCLANKQVLSDKIKEKETIIENAKKDVAYQATQNMLPQDLRLGQDQVTSTGLQDARSYFDYNLNNVCSKFFGSINFFYIALVVLLLVVLKAFFKK